jgi:hypothetical protein
MQRKLAIVAGVSAMLAVGAARAQIPPPFIGGGTAFDPEVGVVQSGAGLDAQATVSADRRYVTITTNLNNSQLLDLKQFAVQQTNFGFVGGVNPAGDADGAGASAAPQFGTASSPTQIANRASILNRRGIFLLAPLP